MSEAIYAKETYTMHLHNASYARISFKSKPVFLSLIKRCGCWVKPDQAIDANLIKHTTDNKDYRTSPQVSLTLRCDKNT